MKGLVKKLRQSFSKKKTAKIIERLNKNYRNFLMKIIGPKNG